MGVGVGTNLGGGSTLGGGYNIGGGVCLGMDSTLGGWSGMGIGVVGTGVVPAPDGTIYLVGINETHYWGSLVRYMYWSQKYFYEKIETYQLLEYESEVIEREKLLKFYRARSTLLYTRV